MTFQDPLVEVEHQVPAELADFLGMHQEICELQDDLIEHL
jgi:hypothetical protein